MQPALPQIVPYLSECHHVGSPGQSYRVVTHIRSYNLCFELALCNHQRVFIHPSGKSVFRSHEQLGSGVAFSKPQILMLAASFEEPGPQIDHQPLPVTLERQPYREEQALLLRQHHGDVHPVLFTHEYGVFYEHVPDVSGHLEPDLSVRFYFR